MTGRSGSASEPRAAALALGLDPDAIYFVAVSSGGDDAALAKALASAGNRACGRHGNRSAHIAGCGQRSTGAGKPAPPCCIGEATVEDEETKEITSTLAISAPVSGVVRVPAAAREAQFIATLQAQARFPHRAASFDSIDDIGAFQLLYPLRDSSELRQFVSAALGILERRDHRGTLRETLRAYLETGGSHADASNRLGIHRNTLAYRLRRISEMIGRDVGDPRTWLTLHLALWASEVLEVDPDER